MWTVIFNVLTVFALSVSLAAIYLAVRSAGVVSELQQVCRDFRKSAGPLLEQRVKECEETLSLLANRVKMTRVRNAVTHAERDKNGEPDAKSDPEAWRAWKNAQLRAGQFNS